MVTVPDGATVAVDWDALTATAVMRRRAYAPYSDFPVGAAGLVDDGRVVVAATSRTRRTASASAPSAAWSRRCTRRAAAGSPHFVCVNGDGEVIMPCGRCRQLLLETRRPRPAVLTVSGVRPMSEVLPDAFGPDATSTACDLTGRPGVVADPYPCFADERARHRSRGTSQPGSG